MLRNEVLRHTFRHENLLSDIKHPQPSLLVKGSNRYHIIFENLKVGDDFNISLGNKLYYLMDQDKVDLNIKVVDTFDKGSDYMPKNLKQTTFSGGYENSGFTHTYDYLDDKTCLVRLENTGLIMDMKYEYDEELSLTAKAQVDVGQDFSQTYRKILPKTIRLGQTWGENQAYMITGVDVLVETPIGLLKAIEVTGFYESGEKITYYTKELGRVLSRYFGLEDKLIKVEFKE